MSNVEDTLLYSLAIVAAIWYSAVLAISLLGCQTARRRYRCRPRSPLASQHPSTVPGVSIIRPLKGLDPNIYENLETTFTQDYPKFELILAVADASDPVIPVIADLQSKYPHVDLNIVIGDAQVGMNPKVNNLIRPFQVAKYDILWVIDSGIQVAPGTLARSVDALIHPPPSEIKAGKRMGIVHHVPFAISDAPDSFKCWGGRLEEAFLNTNHAKMYLALNALAIESCVVGKSNMYHRSDINQLTGALSKQETKSSSPRGLAAFGKFLAEDNMIAAALWHELDLAHTLSCDVVHNVIGDMTLWDYVQRRIRWIRVRKHIVLAATLLEPFQEFMLFTALSASAFVYLFGIPAWVFVLIHSFGWLYIDLDVYASLAGHPLPSSRRWGFLWSWFLRELLTLPIWVVAVAGNEVRWRGRSYRVVQNGEAQEVVDD